MPIQCTVHTQNCTAQHNILILSASRAATATVRASLRYATCRLTKCGIAHLSICQLRSLGLPATVLYDLSGRIPAVYVYMYAVRMHVLLQPSAVYMRVQYSIALRKRPYGRVLTLVHLISIWSRLTMPTNSAIHAKRSQIQTSTDSQGKRASLVLLSGRGRQSRIKCVLYKYLAISADSAIRYGTY